MFLYRFAKFLTSVFGRKYWYTYPQIRIFKSYAYFMDFQRNLFNKIAKFLTTKYLQITIFMYTHTQLFSNTGKNSSLTASFFDIDSSHT